MNTPKVTAGITMTLDGFTAGHNQSFEHPFGDNFSADLLDNWMFAEPEKQKHKKEIDAVLDAARSSWAAICSDQKTEEKRLNGKVGGVTIPRTTRRFSYSLTRSVSREKNERRDHVLFRA